MVSGGIIIVDDIKNNHAWDGAYQAFNECKFKLLQLQNYWHKVWNNKLLMIKKQ